MENLRNWWRYSDSADFLRFISTLLLTMGAALALFVFGANAISARSCAATWSGTGYESSYSLFAGCRVRRIGSVEWRPEPNQQNVTVQP